MAKKPAKKTKIKPTKAKRPIMNNLNYCLKCTGTIKPKTYKPLSKSLLKIHHSNQKINPKLSKLIDQLLNQKYA